MKCFACGSKTKVINSRKGDDPKLQKGISTLIRGWTSDWVYRRRECTGCRKRFHTIELVYEDLVDGWKPRWINDED